jgi:hypothetical protein
MILLIVLRIYLIVMIVIKSYLHTYLADKNGGSLGGGGSFSFKTLWFYNIPVTDEYELLKKRCNWLQIHNMFLLALVIFLSFLF